MGASVGSSQGSEPGSGLVARLRGMSRPAATLLIGGTILVVLASLGLFTASRDTEIPKEQAVEIAKQQVDFEPEQIAIRFVRRTVRLAPAWAVSLSTVDESGDEIRLSVVQIDAATGEVLQVVNER